MADELTDQVETEDSSPKGLREALARKEAELEAARKEANTYRVRALEAAFKEAGLDPTKGVGKAVAKEFTGDPDVEAIRAYAQSEYGWEPPSQEPEIAGTVREATARVAAVTQDAVSQPTTQLDQQIAEAEQSGNFAQAIALKVQRFRTSTGQ